VEVDGENMRIVSRATEVIKVAGENVYPAEIESALLEMAQISEANVFAETHPLTGQIL
jgi:acyl-coenzyme A synthetase/AMP-(fatty) acid ligase